MTILPQLKAHTRASHARVEALVRVMDDPLPRGQYLAILTDLGRFYAPLEAALGRHDLPPAFAFEQRRKLPLLARDLAALGAEFPPAAPGEALPRLDGRAHALGSLYVLEGATLGGQLIARHLDRQLGLHAGSGAAFFSSYGALVGPMWRSFGEALTAYAARVPGEDAAILAGAERTFGALEGWLTRTEVACG